MSTHPAAPAEASTIVIGAGPGGLSCAARLADHGVPVQVFEASGEVGGLARSFSLWGQTVDVGPHRFLSSDRIVTEHWMRFVGEEYTLVDRLTRIFYQGRYFRYPLQPWDALVNLRPADVVASVASYTLQRLRPAREARTLEDWVVQRFGRHLFNIFFKTYTEKLWGIPCTRLDADWAAQRIKRLSLGEALKAALLGDRGRKHKTLADQFAYPRGGSGSVYRRMAEHVRARGGRVHLEAPIRRVLVDGDGRACGVVTQDGREHRAAHVVSTMPLTAMVKGLPHVPDEVRAAADALYFRNTVLVYLEVDSDRLFPDNWIYVHAPDVQHGRITNFRNWCPSLYGSARTSIVCLEYWCFDRDALWSMDAGALGALATAELERLGLVPRGARVLRSHVLRVPRSYPVYETGYQAPLRRLQAFVDSVPGLIAVGRYGAFKYNNQDHSILMGLLAATEILTGRRQDLWSVNSDSQYQESAEVKALFARPASPPGASGHPLAAPPEGEEVQLDA